MYRRTIAYLTERLGTEPDILNLNRVGQVRRMANLLRFPAEVARYVSPANRARVRAWAPAYRCVVVFHEYCFASVREPAILVAHNVHSLIASSDPSPLIRATAGIARRFERRYFANPQSRLVLIAHGDRDALRASGVDRDDTRIAPPGAPPGSPLRDTAAVLAEIVMTGSFGWWRKRRDVRRLAREPECGVPILVADDVALALMGRRAAPLSPAIDWSAAIRFGLIADRFAGGFKLKALEYVANNCVVLSYVDLSREFEGLPHSELFIRHIASLDDASTVIAGLARDADTADKFRVFKAACLQRYRWDDVLRPLGDLIADALAEPERG